MTAAFTEFTEPMEEAFYLFMRSKRLKAKSTIRHYDDVITKFFQYTTENQMDWPPTADNILSWLEDTGNRKNNSGKKNSQGR